MNCNCTCTQADARGCRNLYLCGCACHTPDMAGWWERTQGGTVPADATPEPAVWATIRGFIDGLEEPA